MWSDQFFKNKHSSRGLWSFSKYDRVNYIYTVFKYFFTSGNCFFFFVRIELSVNLLLWLRIGFFLALNCLKNFLVNQRPVYDSWEIGFQRSINLFGLFWPDHGIKNCYSLTSNMVFPFGKNVIKKSLEYKKYCR